MRLGPLAFPWWTAVVAAGLCAAGVALGNWQSGRAAEKRAIAERLAGYERAPLLRLGARPVAADDYLWHKVEAHGEFDANARCFSATGCTAAGPGITSLRRCASNGPRYVLVLRGWLPSGKRASGTRGSPGHSRNPGDGGSGSRAHV